MSKKKKIIVLVSMVALLVLTGCLNYFLNRPGTADAGGDATVTYADYFTSSRNDRTATRADTVMYYNAILESEASSAEAKSSAEAQLEKLLAAMETEQRLETLIKSIGFDECLVTVGSENINVIVKSDALTDNEVAQMLDIILTETNKKATNVRIKPIEG